MSKHDPKTVDLKPHEYTVNKVKKREPIFNWEYVPAALSFLVTGAAAKFAVMYFTRK